METNETSATQALHAAIQRNDFDAFNAALTAGAPARATSASGATALHDVAVQWGDLRALDALVARGAEVGALTTDGETPLRAAVGHAHYARSQPEKLIALVGWFAAHGADLAGADKAGRTLIDHALDRADLPLVRCLRAHGVELPRDALRRVLAIGAASCDLDLLRYVMAEPMEHELAVRDGFGATLAHQAAESARTLFLLEWLQARGADLRATDSFGRTVAARAAGALGGNLPALEFLKQQGALTHGADREGATPLHAAAGDPRPAVLRWLLAAGADLAARDARGRRALDVAIDTHRFASRSEEQKLELATLLGGGGADLLRGRFFNHPLHVAVAARDLGAIKKLLKQGVSANTKNESGDTPLRAAIDRVSRLPFTPDEHAFGRKLLPLLIEAGADPTLRMGDGFVITYAEHARQLGVAAELAAALR